MKRQQETGRSLYTSMVAQAQQTGGRHLRDVAEAPPSTATEQEADAVTKAIASGRRKGGILKNYNYGGPLARVTSNATDATEDEEDPATARFALPIGYLTTEEAPRADLAMQSPSIAMLAETAEDWDDPPPPKARNRARSRSPAPHAGERRDSDAMSDEESDDGMLGPARIVEHRRPSMRETTPWLADILRDKPAPRNRSTSRNRDSSVGRSPGRRGR